MASLKQVPAAAKAPHISPAKRLSSTVYDEVKARILAGEYAPGDWLSVEDLCRGFQVSRQPVMEAMRRLSGEWLVEIVPQVGCRVALYDPQAFRDFLATFGEMEGHLGALAAERRTPEQIALLTTLLDRLNRNTKPGLVYRDLIRQFHSTVLEMAHSAVLARLCEQMWDFGDFVFSTLGGSHVDEALLRQTQETLERLVEAIQVQNSALARLHMAIWLTGVLAAVPTDAKETAAVLDEVITST